MPSGRSLLPPLNSVWLTSELLRDSGTSFVYTGLLLAVFGLLLLFAVVGFEAGLLPFDGPVVEFLAKCGLVPPLNGNEEVGCYRVVNLLQGMFTYLWLELKSRLAWGLLRC